MKWLVGIALVVGASCAPGPPGRVVDAGAAVHPRAVTGPLAALYWGRWDDVPDGVRVAVWLDGDGARVRGSWDLPPWHGDLAGTRDGDRVQVTWREEGTVALTQSRMRTVVLQRDPATGVLRGNASGEGGVNGVELRPAGFAPAGLRPGLWLSRWTGLPPGMAVETVLARDPDGRWRAAYRYQGREGSFEGDVQPDGALAIRWREVSTRDAVSSGRGLLAPTAFGLRGTYGVGERAEGTGDWSLEPVAAP